MIGQYKIIDAHCHVYPAAIAHKAVGGTDAFYGVTSVYDGTVETYDDGSARYRAAREFQAFVDAVNGRDFGFCHWHLERLGIGLQPWRSIVFGRT